MANRLTVVMYHHVFGDREPARLKGLRVSAFRDQLRQWKTGYAPVSLADCLAAIRGESPLPPQAILLTFDDGYREHYSTVLPLLLETKLPAVFFPAAQPIAERKLLDVNKIHFLLAARPDTAALVREVLDALAMYRAAYGLPSNDELTHALARPFGFDNAETIFVKRLFQRELPQPLRSELLAKLFHRYVSRDEAALTEELYLSPGQVREMAAAGMAFGNHTWSHPWLSSLPEAEQAKEIERGLALLREHGTAAGPWAFAYPYGDYNAGTVQQLAAQGCALALTTRPASGSLDTETALAFPRWDTLDFTGGSAPSRS